MDDKFFEWMEKMYAGLNNRFDDLKKEIQHVGNQVTNLENNAGKKFDALFDGYGQLYEKQEEQDKRFDVIEDKLDALSMEISKQKLKLEVLEGGKK